MMLLKRYLRSELKTLLTNNIRFRVIGRMDDLAHEIQDELRAAMDRTANDSGMLFNIALNYGGRAEIVDAARRAIEAGIRPEELDEQRFASFLYTAGQPDPDLLIRTSGEMRVSNYPPLADRVHGDLRHRDALARLPAPTPVRSRRRVPEARAALRRHRPLDCAPVKPALNDACHQRCRCGRRSRLAAILAFFRSSHWRRRGVPVAGLAADEYSHVPAKPVPSARSEQREVASRWVVIAAVVFACWWAAVPAPLSIVAATIIVIVWLAFAVLRQSRTVVRCCR